MSMGDQTVDGPARTDNLGHRTGVLGSVNSRERSKSTPRADRWISSEWIKSR